ncbi:MAG: ATP-binding protein [Candidatus Aenigmatarchaeota archaeon]
MVLKETLKNVAKLQRKEFKSVELGIPRDILKTIDLNIPHAIILSGVRRCGKSTLLKQLINKINKYYYFNFEDQRALGFVVRDFENLDSVFNDEFGKSKTYFFDEIQNVDEWERFVRSRQDSGKKFIITGSNASLLSKELGTRLTGRHINYELFPFSYSEMLQLESKKSSLDSFGYYMKNGGFPEFLKYKKIEMLQELFNDIIVRDIITRYGLRETKIIKEMAIYLLTNVGKEFSYTNLAKYFNLGSTNTAISYVSYFEDSYLLFTIPMFDYSFRKQLVNPKKAYSIDVGLSRANSASFSDDKGRIFENIIFLELRRRYKEIFYFKGKKECDFLVKEKGKLKEAIQVCYELTEENKERELSGLQEAMEKLKINKGTIITLNQDDRLGDIAVKPAWKWLLMN